MKIGFAILLAIAAMAAPARAQVNVVDSKGKIVGAWDGGFALRQINGSWLDLLITSKGFDQAVDPVCCALYTTANCSGQVYFPSSAVGLAETPALQMGGNVYFGKGPLQQATIQSCSSFTALAGALVATGECYVSQSNGICALGSGEVAPMGSASLAALKLTPPFHLAK